ncbi:MAG: DHA2 family efflux MFS transporter permease subunit [Sulfurifustaceae bacterium]
MKQFLIVLGVMLAAFMQVLDMTIVSVAMPHMQGALGATPDQVSWVLTSYLVASAVFMPLNGYFTDKFGQKKFLLATIFGFVATSALCGLAGNLTTMVLFRVLQGAFGAALIPLSQSIMVRLYPAAERGRAMAIWGMGIMLGPVLGPTLGGILTDLLNWRWTFYINIPIGALSWFIAWRLAPDTEVRQRDMNWLGFAFMAFGVGCLQLLFDRGNQEDWFESRFIQFLALFAVVGIFAFIVDSRRAKHPVIRFEIFRDPNFAKACFFLGIFGLGLFDATILRPLMMEDLMGYTPTDVGLVQGPSGIASMVAALATGRLLSRFKPYAIILVGVIFCTVGTYFMVLYSPTTDKWFLIWPNIVTGLGFGSVFTPLSTFAFSTLAPQSAAEAAGAYNFIRTMGSSAGISLTATVMTQHGQAAWQHLAERVHVFNPNVESYLSGVGLMPTDPMGAALIAHELGRQAQMLAILDGLLLNTWLFAILIPIALFLRPRRAPAPVAAPVPASIPASVPASAPARVPATVPAKT